MFYPGTTVLKNIYYFQKLQIISKNDLISN